MPEVTSTAPESRSGYNGTGATIPRGTILKLVAGGKDDQIDIEATATGVFYGVAAEAIEDKTYGVVYIRGRVPVIASAALTVGGRVTATTGGKAVNAAGGNATLGIAVQAGAANVLAEVELTGPGGPLS